MWIIETISGAVIAWIVPKLLDFLLASSQRQATSAVDLSIHFPWIRWCSALTIAGALGGFISGLITMSGWHVAGGVGNWTAFGVCIGIAQWLVLKPYNHFGAFWAVSCALGWSLFSIFEMIQAPGFIGWLAVGLAIGLLQWLMLRKQRSRAYLWVPANMLAWLIAGTVSVAFGAFLLSLQVPFALAWVIGWAVVGFVGSLILGWALSLMPLDSSQ